MTRVEATLADLELLAVRLGRLDDDVRPYAGRLAAAIERAWATNPGLLGPISTLDGELGGLGRRSRDLTVAIDRARHRLDEAGGGLLVAATGSTTLRHLAAAAATPAGHGIDPALWRLLSTALFGRPPRSETPPYVVSTSTETLAVSTVVDTAITYVREVLSDGSVRITELLESGAGIVGAGLGARCSLAVDGHTLVDHGLRLSATLGAAGTAGQTWVFAGEAAAERWWRERRRGLQVSAFLRAFPLGGGALTRLHRWVTGHDPDPDGSGPDESFEEVSITGTAEASGSDPLTAVALSAFIGATVRRSHDGTITVSTPFGATANARVGVVPQAPWRESTIGLEGGIELTLRNGAPTMITVRSLAVDRSGIDVTGAEQLGLVPVEGGIDDVSVYETTIELDLTDESVRTLVNASLPDGSERPGAATLAGLWALLADERLLRAATVTVLERALPAEQLWRVSCSWDLPGRSGSFGATTGHTSQETRHVWFKAPGEATVRPAG
ncbi:MAG: hypothetical protein ACKO04_08110 [Actinomycetes bacterium]